MNIRCCALILLFTPAASSQYWLEPEADHIITEPANGGSLEQTLTMEPVMTSNFKFDIDPKEPLLIQHDVAVTTYDEPSRLYLLENRKLKPYLGEFRGSRIYQFEGDPSPWQYGPALGAKYSLTPSISFFTEYHRGWWGIDTWDWMTERGDSIHMGIQFEFGGSKKSK